MLWVATTSQSVSSRHHMLWNLTQCFPAGAPDHPHRGFETISYLLAGASTHKDSAVSCTNDSPNQENVKTFLALDCSGHHACAESTFSPFI